ncbi:tautomerase family protein [Flavisphingomonas formosensis]|uniref:tautomerase family protein n=1 Tax=Flavisphingomonas formosensis TaxID=861534 RepID=UPI0012F906AC|nr:4-oxalocrotonate tautomerase family protein [Sphingomonas formosensis]
MPFVDIRIAGSATREQKAAIVADVTRALGEHLGKPASAVQVNITELSTENYGSGGLLIADPAAPPKQEVASADGTR